MFCYLCYDKTGKSEEFYTDTFPVAGDLPRWCVRVDIALPSILSRDKTTHPGIE